MNCPQRAFTRFLLQRLSEKSTWAGLGVALATLAGHTMAPEYADAIGVVGSFVASVCLVLVQEDRQQ